MTSRGFVWAVGLVAMVLTGCTGPPEALPGLPTLPPAEATQSAVTRRGIVENFVGEYGVSAEDAYWKVWVKSDLTYEQESWFGVGNQRFRSAGRVVPRGATVWLVTNSESEPEVLRPIRWGERRYLVEAGALGRFCAPDSGEPRTTREGYFYLRDGDWSRPAEGVPTLLDGTPACK